MQDLEPGDFWVNRDEVILQMESENLELLMQDDSEEESHTENNTNYTITLEEEMDEDQYESLC